MITPFRPVGPAQALRRASVLIGTLGLATLVACAPTTATPAGARAGGASAAPARAAPAASGAQTRANAASAVTEVTLVGTEFKLDPATLTVPAGRPVRLTFVNKGAIEHDWEADGFTASNVRVVSTSPGLPARLADEMAQKAAQGLVHPMAGAGQQVVLEFTPTAAGTYHAACQIPGHKEAGMRGTLVVR